MATTRSIITNLSANVSESMGGRPTDQRPQLAPVASPKDAGRRPMRQVGTIEIDRVVPDPDQPRAEFDDEAIKRLAKSIQTKGQLLPSHVRWSDKIGKWIIISGERRWRAAKQAGMPTIDCHFHEQAMEPAEILEQQLIENLLREDLKPIEQARAFESLMKFNGWGVRQVADALRIPASTVSRALALLRLPDDMQRQVDAGEIAARSAYEISKVSDVETRDELAAQAAAGNLTRDQVVDAVQQRRGKTKRKRANICLTFVAENGVSVGVSASRSGSYHDVETALIEALEEVRHRLSNNVQLF